MNANRVTPLLLLALLLTGFTSACADKAEPDLKRCEQLQAEKKANEALEACKKAVAADSESKAGKRASEITTVLEAQIAKAEQEAKEKAEAERKEADKKARIAEAETVMKQWLESQNSQDFAAYERLFAEDFYGVKRVGDKTKEFDRKGWLFDRKGMFTHHFAVTATKREVAATEKSVTITFTQDWTSRSYADSGKKEIVVERRDGKPLITREVMLSSSVERDLAECEQTCQRRCFFAARYTALCWLVCIRQQCGEDWWN